MSTTTAASVGAPTNAYLLSFQPDYLDAPLLVYLPGLDETGKELISLQTASFEEDFNVRALVIPSDDLGDWDVLAAATIALVKDELTRTPKHLPVYLCGESFGGCLALKVLEKAPELFERVILSNPASSFHRVWWLSLGATLFPLLPAPLYELSASVPVVSFLASPNRISAEARRGLLASTRSAPKETLQRRLALMRDFRADESKLRRLNIPVLLIGSKKDRILPSVNEVYRLERIFARSQVVILPYSGHACLVETDVNLDEIMRSHHFMSSLAPV